MSNRAKRKFPRLRVIVVMLILLGVMYLWLRENKEEEATVREIKAPVTVIKPLYGEMVQTFKIRGILNPNRWSRSAQISGTLVSSMWRSVTESRRETRSRNRRRPLYPPARTGEGRLSRRQVHMGTDLPALRGQCREQAEL
jgi:hypothetical protein